MTPELARARELVLRHGWNTTAYQILNPGFQLWFSAAQDAVAGFVRHRRVRVVAGAPVCAAERLPDVAAELERSAHAAGDRVCYLGAEGRLESLYRGRTTHTLALLGAQPTWNPQHWDDMLRRRASVRAQLNRARNKGVGVEEWPRERAQTSHELRRCLAEWLGMQGLPPLHFLVEPEMFDRLFDRRVFVADRNSDVVGYLIATPVPCRNGWIVEQVVRARAAPNGTAELLIDAAMRAVARAGSDFATLGISPLSERIDQANEDNPLWLRMVLAWVRAHARRFYNFEGLERFKTKFSPAGWDPIYAVVNEPSFSPSTLYAITAAYAAGSPLTTLARALLNAVRTEVRWLASR